jgi:hypothetical protein
LIIYAGPQLLNKEKLTPAGKLASVERLQLVGRCANLAQVNSSTACQSAQPRTQQPAMINGQIKHGISGSMNVTTTATSSIKMFM